MTTSATFRHDAPGTPATAWDDWVAAAGRSPLRLLDRDSAPIRRLVVVAAHPDDEVLGAGGLIALAGRQPAVRVTVVLLSAGEASHPASTSHDPRQLAARREQECRAGLAELGPAVDLAPIGLPDGGLAAYEEECVAAVVAAVGDGRGVLLVAPWRHDGHPDHDAAGRAAAVAATRTGARLLEYPVWWWHWGDPTAAPADTYALPLDADAVRAKARAIARHRSQVEPLSPAPGDEQLLGADFLAHFRRGHEVFVEQAAGDSALDDVHEGGAEPWGADTRWYEARKRALLLAMLPRRVHARALDVGCSTGVTTQALADRSESVVAVDASEAAVASARERLAGLAHVEVERRDLPGDWPDGRFDLVVVSEVGYFLSAAALEQLVDRVAGCLTDDGVVVLGHWRHPVAGWPLDGPDVHAAFESHPGWSRLASYADRDVELALLGHPDVLPDPSR